MAKEAIEKIRAAEEEAKKIIQEAHSKGREILNQADEQIRKNEASIMAETKLEADGILLKAREDAERSVEGTQAEGRTTVDSILDIDDSRVDKAAEVILRRIVKTNGNS